MDRSIANLGATFALSTVVALVAAASARAATFAPGTRVEASPQQMEQFWEPCTIESGPDQWDRYFAKCGDYVLPVPAKWVREPRSPAPTSAASPAAAPAPAAPPPPPAAIPAASPPARVATGSYECWAFNSARMSLNFEVTGSGEYTAAADGSEGEFSYQPQTGVIAFSGYLRESMPDGFTAIYHEKTGRPTVSFRGRGGDEASFCERMGSSQ